MASFLAESSYGKSCVRLTKVTRRGEHHDLMEMSVSIQLRGDFDRSYTDGDNSQIVATDTMKNTVYALAAQHDISSIEGFGKIIADHFVVRNKHVRGVSVEIRQDRFERIMLAGKPHAHSFAGGNKEKRTARVEINGKQVAVTSGIEDLVVLKTTDSEFSGFLRDEYTTLADTSDRIFATTVAAHWNYNRQDADYDAVYEKIRTIILEVFATHHSLAVQQTLYEMGKVVLEKCAHVEDIAISMPNQHRIPFDLSKFGLANKNEIFVPTDEPYGLISATMSRSAAAAVGTAAYSVRATNG